MQTEKGIKRKIQHTRKKIHTRYNTQNEQIILSFYLLHKFYQKGPKF